ncbi:MAG: hypothetical protein UT30_C0001G0053 [Candidatus Uhrbacteria bacterium GW2011_GWF2_39_13]|uniref:Uncharacterized protein n=1 Tax=Candidatus Uhrbacteria bacterium GW2011_GWF2_39_13 TaxID=1618995 RepID=A0A0G0MM35_9BACT|nr:MAG: hypothetical protein UT30_C0001G0053 [Candidatus Uhrbacteria bacterium GW2011_GWF2_39_13]HAU66379.1 hypothetical protein [Candidatus Uhrbacteria bacterium]
MKKFNQHPFFAAAAVVAVVGVSAMGVQTLFAASSESADGTNNLVETIATTFHLNTEDVQEVFDEHREQIETRRGEREANMLDQAVTNEKLTQEQADSILAKRQEMTTFIESLSSLDKEARHEAMKAQMNELKQWADENDIPLYYLHPGPRGGMHSRFGHDSQIPDEPIESNQTQDIE